MAILRFEREGDRDDSRKSIHGKRFGRSQKLDDTDGEPKLIHVEKEVMELLAEVMEMYP